MLFLFITATGLAGLVGTLAAVGLLTRVRPTGVSPMRDLPRIAEIQKVVKREGANSQQGAGCARSAHSQAGAERTPDAPVIINVRWMLATKTA